MSNEINLSKKRVEKLGYETKIARILQIISIVFLFVTLVISIVFFLLNRSLPLEALTTQQNSLLAQIKPYDNTIVSLIHIHDRITNIQAISRSRITFTKYIDDIKNLVPSSVSIDSLAIDDKKNLTLSISSGQLLSLDEFVGNLISQMDKKQLIQKITISGLNNSNTTYQLSITGSLL